MENQRLAHFGQAGSRGDHWVMETTATGSDRSLRGQEDTLHPRGHGKHLPMPMHVPSTSETEERSP